MREQKFADILEEDEKNNKTIEQAEEELEQAEKELEQEEKLSMTRRLKFKELQDRIDRDSGLKDSITENFDLTSPLEREALDKKFEKFIAEDVKTSKKTIEERDTKDELVMPRIKGEIKVVAAYSKPEKKVEEQENVKNKEKREKSKKNIEDKEQENTKKNNVKLGKEDISLTDSYKPLKKKFSFSKLFKRLFILLLIVWVVYLCVYFVAIPIYNIYINSKPQVIFSGTIDYVTDKSISILDTFYNDNGINNEYSFNFDVKSEDKSLEKLSKYDYGILIVDDLQKNRTEASYYIKEQNKKYGMGVLINNKNYLNFVGTELYLQNLISDSGSKEEWRYDTLARQLKKVNKVNKEDASYLIKQFGTILKDVVLEEKIIAEKDEIEINGKSISVIKNSLVIDKAIKERMTKKIAEKLLSDDKVIDILAKMYDTKIENMQKHIEEQFGSDKLQNDTGDFKYYVNIYTMKGNKVVGFEIEKNGFRDIYWYKDVNNNFEFYINLSENCLNKENCNGDDRKILKLVGKKANTNLNIDIYYNSKDIGEIRFNTFEENKIDFEYELDMNKNSYKGDFVLEKKDDSQYNLKFSYKTKTDDLKLDLVINLNSNGKIVIKGPKIVPYSAETLEREYETYINSIEDEDLREAYGVWNDLITEYLKVLDNNVSLVDIFN